MDSSEIQKNLSDLLRNVELLKKLPHCMNDILDEWTNSCNVLKTQVDEALTTIADLRNVLEESNGELKQTRGEQEVETEKTKFDDVTGFVPVMESFYKWCSTSRRQKISDSLDDLVSDDLREKCGQTSNSILDQLVLPEPPTADKPLGIEARLSSLLCFVRTLVEKRLSRERVLVALVKALHEDKTYLKNLLAMGSNYQCTMQAKLHFICKTKAAFFGSALNSEGHGILTEKVANQCPPEVSKPYPKKESPCASKRKELPVAKCGGPSSPPKRFRGDK